MPITTDEVAKAVKAWCNAWDTHDISAILDFESDAAGFGYRHFARRDHKAMGKHAYSQLLERFFAQMEYYHLWPERIDASVLDSVYYAWGVYIEEFQEKGKSPERARVRFSKTLTRQDNSWKIIAYHRDIQPYDGAGVYPRELTAAPRGGKHE